MPLALILSVGTDPQLLSTRQLLLQSAGYVVVSVLSAKDAVDRFLAGDFDLVLLCHSVPERDRNRVAAQIRASGSLTPVLTVAPYTHRQDVFVSAMTIGSEPQDLLASIRDVLTNHGQKRVLEPLADMTEDISSKVGRRPAMSRLATKPDRLG